MKNIILILMLVVLSGCAGNRVVQPLPPTDSSLKSAYRKTVEVIIVDVFLDDSRKPSKSKFSKDRKEFITVVESTATGERFEVFGNYGRQGDRFKISY